MNDRELDERLKIASSEAEQFFSRWSFEPYRKLVQKRIENGYLNTKRFDRIFPPGTAWRNKAVLIGLSLLLFIPLVFSVFSSALNRHPQQAGVPIAQHPIKLGDHYDTQWVSFFRLDKPDHNRHNLLAVIWETNAADNYRMVYSSLLEDSDIPNPVSTLDFPESSNKLALISSKNREQGYLHYRLIEYNNRAFVTYLEQDFVPDGKVDIKEGIIVEERTVSDIRLPKENRSSISKGMTIVTRFIPYKIDSDGNLILSTDHVKLNWGDYLTFVGYNTNRQIKISFIGEILERLCSDNLSGINGYYTQFHAVSPGRGFIILEPDTNKGPGTKLSIEVEVVRP